LSKTEKQKMLASELYSPGDPELQVDAATNKVRLARYNAALAAPASERHAQLSEHLGHVGRGAVIRPRFDPVRDEPGPRAPGLCASLGWLLWKAPMFARRTITISGPASA
jgi:hypothetical protein